MSSLIEITNLKVRTFSLDNVQLTWEIENTDLDPHDFWFEVLRSESPEGPFDVMTEKFSDRYLFIDNQQNVQFDRWRKLFYKIRVTLKSDTSQTQNSETVSLEGAEPDLIALEIQLRERTLFQEFVGRKCFVFPRRTFGQRCRVCFDPITNTQVRSKCITCYDTTFVSGFFSPIQSYIQFDPSVKITQLQDFGETQEVLTSARLSNFPPVKPRDVIVEPDNRRWRVVKVNNTERLRAIVHQELGVTQIIAGDIEYALPIQLDNLETISFAAGRNFSMPSNMDGFTDEDITNIFGDFGYTETG